MVQVEVNPNRRAARLAHSLDPLVLGRADVQTLEVIEHRQSLVDIVVSVTLAVHAPTASDQSRVVLRV